MLLDNVPKADLMPEQMSEHCLSAHITQRLPGWSLNTCALPSSRSPFRVGIARAKVIVFPTFCLRSLMSY